MCISRSQRRAAPPHPQPPLERQTETQMSRTPARSLPTREALRVPHRRPYIYSQRRTLPGGARAHLPLLSSGDHGTARCGALNGHGPMDNTCTYASGYMRRIMDMDHTVFVADLRRWMNDGNLTASAARPPCGQLRWHLNRRPLPCPQEPSKSRRTWSEMTTPYGFVDAVAEQVRLRCMGSSTPHGYEVALCPRLSSQASPPPSRVRQRLRVHNWVGDACATEQIWAGVAPSTMRDQSLRDEAARPANDSDGLQRLQRRGDTKRRCEKLRPGL